MCNHGKWPSPKAKSFPKFKSASYIVGTKSQFLLRKPSGMTKGVGSEDGGVTAKAGGPCTDSDRTSALQPLRAPGLAEV